MYQPTKPIEIAGILIVETKVPYKRAFGHLIPHGCNSTIDESTKLKYIFQQEKERALYILESI